MGNLIVSKAAKRDFRKIGLTSWSVETTPHLGTVLIARRIGQKAYPVETTGYR